jgi:hypothetical protein
MMLKRRGLCYYVFSRLFDNLYHIESVIPHPVLLLQRYKEQAREHLEKHKEPEKE